ncbi:MAG: hypothetical protein II038_12620 [Lachnospiraceae bacterium]|nr:hypothetical protein [Lachnospiraceae bacterium]
MDIYVGYGFNVNDIKDKDWLNLLKEHARDLYDNLLEEAQEENPALAVADEETLREALEERVNEFLEARYNTPCETLRDIINEGESAAAGTDYIVANYDNYLVFDSVRFADDSKRTQYIRTADDFLTMIARYLPLENLSVGNVYAGNWCDVSFFQE